MIEFGVDNGVLGQVRGEEISAGRKQLPTPSAVQPPEVSAVVDTPDLGKVRITYRLNRSPRPKVNLWFWTACHAVAVPPPEPSTANDPDPAD